MDQGPKVLGNITIGRTLKSLGQTQ